MMFYKFFCIFNRKAKISKKLIFDKPEVPMTVGVRKKVVPRTELKSKKDDLHSKSIVFGRSGFDSRRAQSLRVCIFETVSATAMYFTFLETSNQYLFTRQAPTTWLHSNIVKNHVKISWFHSINGRSFISIRRRLYTHSNLPFMWSHSRTI